MPDEKLVTAGIDLGTTFSATAYLGNQGKPQLIVNSQGDRLTPSAIFFTGDKVVVGEDAVVNAEAFPGQVARFFKRYMGEPTYAFLCNDRSYSAAALSSIVLAKLKDDLVDALKAEPEGVVITVPAYFGDLQRRDTLKAGQMAGLNVAQLINEPTAAAYSYGLHRIGESRQTLVFDLGGGTFDITILDIKGDDIIVRATGGDHQLGGIDWDEALIDYANEAFIKTHGKSLLEQEQSSLQLREKVVRTKLSLSVRRKTLMTLHYEGASLNVEINRQNFEAITKPLVERCRLMVDLILEEAERRPDDIDQVLLVGGATRMPMIKEMLQSFFNFFPSDVLNPDECVAMGAAVKAALLGIKKSPGIKRQNTRLDHLAKLHDINVTSHSFGFVVLKDGELYNSVILPKNTQYPCEMKREDYTTSGDNQATLKVILTEGEEKDPYLCSLIGHYEAYDLPPARAGKLRLRFTYRYNDNQIIEVEAYDLTNKRQLPVRALDGEPDLSSLYAMPLDVVLLLDCSGSMAGESLNQAKLASIEFLKKFDHPMGRIALVTFPGGIMHSLEDSVDEIITKIDRMVAYNGTPMTEGLKESMNKVLKDPYQDRVIVLLTDGAPNNPATAAEAARKAQTDGVRIIAVGVSGANAAFLKSIVSKPEDFHWASEPVKLSESFAQIATQLSSSGLRRH